MPSADALFDAAFARIPDPELSQPSGPRNYLRAAGQVAGNIGQSMLDAARLPGQVAGGEFAVRPQTPGMWSEEDEYRQQRAGNVIESRAKDLAGVVTGGVYSAPSMKNATGMGIRAYHGSPHDFDRFDLSKIGTGEGAQVYGHGLYFAEKEGVAKGYRDKLSQLDTLANQLLQRGGGDKVKALAEFDEILAKSAHQFTLSDLQGLLTTRERIARGTATTGRMYEVDIKTNPDAMFDWDAPIKKSDWGRLPEGVRSAIDDSMDARGMNPMGDVLDEYKGQHLFKAMKHPDVHDALPAKVGSSDWYKGDTDENKHVSEFLREMGFAGVKYLDQGSRKTGDGSRNYVVFDDKLVNILKKYGIAGAAATGAATMGGNQAEAKDDFGAAMEQELQAILAP